MPKGIKGSTMPKPPSARELAALELDKSVARRNTEAVRDRWPMCRCAWPVPSGRWYRNPVDNTKVQACRKCDNPMTKQATQRAVVGAAYGF